MSSRSGALRWGQERERELLLRGPRKPRKEAPTLKEFAPRFIEGARGDRQRASTLDTKERILRVHLLPLLGGKRLDSIGNEDVQRLKNRLIKKNPKTLNNILTVLSRLLKVAVEWGVIDQMPCTIKLVRTHYCEARFHDFCQFEQLLQAARSIGRLAYLIVLLGGEAGLRLGEMLGLRWPDVDFVRHQLNVQRSVWEGHVSTPKGGRSRRIPLTPRLEAALRAQHHLRGGHVLCQPDGKPLTRRMLQVIVRSVARGANIANGGIHVLRHTFCSHLAMRGAPARAIQELAGHRDLSTTMKYLHVSPRAIEDAMRLLEGSGTARARGDIVETGVESKTNSFS